MGPETKAAVTYFSLFLLAGAGMVLQGFHLRKKANHSALTQSSPNHGALLIACGVLLIVWQAYQLYDKLI